MNYSDFTLDAVSKKFNLRLEREPFFLTPGVIPASAWLRETLAAYDELAYFSEKSRSESIVYPILVCCREELKRAFHIFSGITFNVDPVRGLSGECDYILAKSPTGFLLQAPIFVVVEAKKNDIEEGIGQCVAQMIAVQVFNQKEG